MSFLSYLFLLVTFYALICTILYLCVEMATLEEAGLCFLISEPQNIENSEQHISDSTRSHAKSPETSSLTLQIYSFEAVCTGAPRNTHISKLALLFVRGNSRQRVYFSG